MKTCNGLHDDGIADGNLTRCSVSTGCGLTGCPYVPPREDPTCGVCGFKLSEHVATSDGPHTCPRVASGEGRYVLVRPAYTRGGFFPGEEMEMPPLYRFEPAAKFENPCGHGWSPYSHGDKL